MASQLRTAVNGLIDAQIWTPAEQSPLKLRACTMPPRHLFPEHSHAWHQLAYAIEGVLTVTVPGSCLVVPPERAVWIPAKTPHKVGSPSGAKFRTLYVADIPQIGLGDAPAVVSVSPLMRELIVEAVAIGAGGTRDHDEYAGQIVALVLAQLRNAKHLPSALPWPRSGALTALCDILYADPSDCRSLEACAKLAAMSGRTLSRRFEKEVGMTLGAWRRKLRLFRAIEKLNGGSSVTDVALDLGYSTPSAFSHMFRLEMGVTPMELMRANGARGLPGGKS